MTFCPRHLAKPQSRIASLPGRALRTATIGAALCCAAFAARAQQYTKVQRWQAETMLRNVAQDVRAHYFDPLALGSGWDAKVRAARMSIEKADSINEALSAIAGLLGSLGDSHTYFLPPPRPYRDDYGFQMKMIGDRCYVSTVNPQSNAAQKGLRAGDQILALDGYALTRSDIWTIKDVFWKLQPQLQLRLELRPPGGVRQQMAVAASVRRIPAGNSLAGDAIYASIRAMEDQRDAARPVYVEKLNGLLIVKLPLLQLSDAELAKLARTLQGHTAAILDLRGDPGGSQETLKKLVGIFFARKILIGQLVNGRSVAPIVAEPQRLVYTGDLAALTDSETSSAAEIFARVLQLQKRAMVIGDRSAGRVTAAQQFMHRSGVGQAIAYGAVVSEAEILMADGQNLEKNGVIPDREILPTGSDLASGRDPALAAAAEALQVTLTPEETGAIFPAPSTLP